MNKAHPIAGGIALFIILLFWLTTLFTKIWGSPESIIMVKTSIPWGFLVLIPIFILTGYSGFLAAKGHKSPLLTKKIKRMRLIAANGLFILMPSALFLAFKASHASFDTGFMLIQAIELTAGPINIILISLNMRDGIRLSQLSQPLW